MGFVNSRLSEDEMKEYDIPRYGKVKFGGGTIDREKGIRLFDYANGPVREPSDLFDFVFDWDGCVIFVGLKQKLENGIVSWSLDYIKIPENAKMERSEVIEELRQAMKVYGYEGYRYFKSPIQKHVEENILFTNILF